MLSLFFKQYILLRIIKNYNIIRNLTLGRRNLFEVTDFIFYWYILFLGFKPMILVLLALCSTSRIIEALILNILQKGSKIRSTEFCSLFKYVIHPPSNKKYKKITYAFKTFIFSPFSKPRSSLWLGSYLYKATTRFSEKYITTIWIGPMCASLLKLSPETHIQNVSSHRVEEMMVEVCTGMDKESEDQRTIKDVRDKEILLFICLKEK